MNDRGRILVVAGEALWPPNRGGRLRTARIAEQLAAGFDVHVAGPVSATDAVPATVTWHGDDYSIPSIGLRDRVTWRPVLGQTSAPPTFRTELAQLADRLQPAVALYAHSYLAAVSPPVAPFVIVDFPNLEYQRWATFTRQGGPRPRTKAALEAVKARRWESTVARHSDIALAVTPGDARWLERRAQKLIVLPHGTDAAGFTDSPPDGAATYVANATYKPNRDAGWFLITDVWPRVRARKPDARLVVVGTGTSEAFASVPPGQGIDVVGEVDDIAPYFVNAALLVAPVSEGGGAQLKVTEALAYGRVVVATTYSARSVPVQARQACVATDTADSLARHIAELLADVRRRRTMEQALRTSTPVVPAWRDVCLPLVDELKACLGAHDRGHRKPRSPMSALPR